MQTLPIEQWRRKEHFAFYAGLDIPFYSICFEMDVTKLYNLCHSEQLPFYYALIYCVMQAANSVEEFRTRVHGGTVTIYDSLIPSFTALDKGSDLHKICNYPLGDSMRDFAIKAKAHADAQDYYFPSADEEAREDYVFISCAPWCSFTALTNACMLNKEDYIPRINWGKHEKHDERVTLSFSMQLNHRIIDGFVLGQFQEKLRKILDEVN